MIKRDKEKKKDLNLVTTKFKRSNTDPEMLEYREACNVDPSV